MVELSRAHEDHIGDLLRECKLARDALPYTEEFSKLKEAFWDRSFKKLSDAEFWQAIANVAKKGGIRGKAKVHETPQLTDEQREMLRNLLRGSLGQRDRLPYTDRFEKMVSRFNGISGLSLIPRQVWLAILNIAK